MILLTSMKCVKDGFFVAAVRGILITFYIFNLTEPEP